ncbi:hypothetical protein MKW92_048771 [Papaver armeniacum]|nr:hypothetical protein MKW92_048771 [Papaver armeniacum]
MATALDMSFEDHRLKEKAERIKIEESFNEEENLRLITFSMVFGNTYKRRFFKKNKLCLVLDLDHTLLHSVCVRDVSKDDQDYLNKKAIVVSSRKGMPDIVRRSGDNLYNYMGRYTKLRPHTRYFLKQLSDRFKLFGYTMGSWEHARDMANLLDPKGVFFESIVSKDDSTIINRKNLDILAGPDKKNTIIIDDNKSVWEEHKKNVIRIDKYKYFTEQNGGHILNKHEDEEGFGDKDRTLKSLSKFLEGVHKNFFKLFPVPQTDVEFQEYIKSADVRPLLKAYLKKRSDSKLEESKQVPSPLDNIVEDLTEDENRVQDADETCDQEPSKVDISYEDRVKEVETILKRIQIRELSCNEQVNRRLIGFSREFGNTFKKCCFQKSKLCLVLDLDHTLLHSVSICDDSKDDREYLNKKAIVISSEKDMKGVVASSGDNLYKYKGMYTKLRPHTRKFLKQLGDSFELFVYTMGTWDYARNMGRLLDPEGVFFKSIVSRDDSTIRNRKNLDILAGPDEKNTIIIDDHEHVWEEHRNNVMRIDKYKYFTQENGGHILKKNEEKGFGDDDESLKSIYKDLRRVHKKFFQLFPVPQTDVELQEYIESADVRPILKACLKKLSG